MIFLGIILIGIVSLNKLKVELMPDTSYEDISIIIRIRGGIPPSEVEMLVTKPIEEAVAGVTHLRELISISEEGESRVVLRFEPGTDMDFAALEVRERFSRVRDQLPRETEKPVIAKYQKSDMPVVILGITGQGYTPEMLRRIVDEQVKERFQRIEGVANVDVYGGRERKILVEANQNYLQSYSIRMSRLINVLNLNNLNLLAGDVDQKHKKLLVRSLGQFENLDHIKDLGVAITQQGTIIRVRDIATVRDSFLEPIDLARVDTKPVVSMYIFKESMANSVEVSSKVNEEIEAVKQDLDENIILKSTYDQAIYINRAIKTVRDSLIWGGSLAVLILLFFLTDVRPTLLIGLTIPLSIMATFSLMFIQNLTLNVITLSGLALGIGMLLDNAIVIIENIFRKRQEGVSKTIASLEGSQEMMLAIIASTITTIVVFLPIIFVSKEIQLMYSGLAWTVTFSLVASLFIALTLIPLVSSRLNLRSGYRAIYVKIRAYYRKMLGYTLRHKYIFIAIVFGLFFASLYFARGLGVEFIGVTEQNKFTVHVELPTGAKLEKSSQAVAEVEAILSEFNEIETISSRIERWSSKVYVKLKPLDERLIPADEIVSTLRPRLEKIQVRYDCFIYFDEPQQVGSKEMILDIYGYDYDILKKLAVGIASRLQTVDDLTDIKIRMRQGRPEFRLYVDEKRAAFYGLSVKDIAEQVHARVRGLRATYYHTEAKEVELVCRLQEYDRQNFRDIQNLALGTPSGNSIFLEEVLFPASADKPRFAIGPSEIWRKNKIRMVQVSASRGVLALNEAADKIKEQLTEFKFPKDYYYQIGGDYEKLVKNQAQLTLALVLTLVLVFLVLASLFESYTQPFVIMTTVPLAMIGVTCILKITNTSINIGGIIGIMMLAGIVVNNAIVMIDLMNRLRKDKKYSALRAVLRGGEWRIRPILMTATTTILGLLPMAIDKSEASNLWSPLALTVIGGMTTSTFLTLFIIPCMYLALEDTIRVSKKVVSKISRLW